jgi:hypothetical protein
LKIDLTSRKETPKGRDDLKNRKLIVAAHRRGERQNEFPNCVVRANKQSEKVARPRRVIEMTRLSRTIILSLLVFSVALATFSSAYAAFWMDPPIPDTPYHVWVEPNAILNITVNELGNGDIRFKVDVIQYECDGETYGVGINESTIAPPDETAWIYHETATCGKKIKIQGVYSGE